MGDPGSIHGLGRSPGEGNGNPLQHSCLENPMLFGCPAPWPVSRLPCLCCSPTTLSVVGAALGGCCGLLSPLRPAGRLEPFLALKGAQGRTAPYRGWCSCLSPPQPTQSGASGRGSPGPRPPNRQAWGCGDRFGQVATRGLLAGRPSGGGCSPQTLQLSALEWALLPLNTGPGLRLLQALLTAGLPGGSPSQR